MTLSRLAEEYRGEAAKLYGRMSLIKNELSRRDLSKTEKMHLRGRLAVITSMYRDVSEAASVMEHYYDRRYKRNGRYSV